VRDRRRRIDTALETLRGIGYVMRDPAA